MTIRDPVPACTPPQRATRLTAESSTGELVFSPMIVASPIPVDTAGLDAAGLSRRTPLAGTAALGGHRLVQLEWARTAETP